jgi:hypothetical protein
LPILPVSAEKIYNTEYRNGLVWRTGNAGQQEIRFINPLAMTAVLHVFIKVQLHDDLPSTAG